MGEEKIIEAKKYEETGFLFPIDVVADDEIKLIRKDFELAENELADDPKRLSLLRSYPLNYCQHLISLFE